MKCIDSKKISPIKKDLQAVAEFEVLVQVVVVIKVRVHNFFSLVGGGVVRRN